MRLALMVIGLVLLVGGIYLAFGHVTYSSTETLAQMGSNSLKVTRQKDFPKWVAYAGIAVGAILALAGVTRKR